MDEEPAVDALDEGVPAIHRLGGRHPPDHPLVSRHEGSSGQCLQEGLFFHLDYFILVRVAPYLEEFGNPDNVSPVTDVDGFHIIHLGT